MTDLSSMTKADLLKEVGALEERFAQLRKTPPAAPEPKRVPEAEAIAACVRALDIIEENTNSYGMRKSGTTDRVIKHLATKYGINLIEVHTLPCDRPHADEIDPATIGYAVQQAMSGVAR